MRNTLIVVLLASSLVFPGCSAADDSDNWQTLPVVPSISGAVRESFLRDLARSRELGMRPKVFAKVGDSNTEMAPALYGLGCREARLDGRRNLRKVIHRYRAATLPNDKALPGCARGDSFSRHSSATQASTYLTWSIERTGRLPESGPWARPAGCPDRGTPMSCELDAIRPRYTIIMTGTNDYLLDKSFGLDVGEVTRSRMDRVIAAVRKLGSVPVVSTLPPLLADYGGPEAINPINREIVSAAKEHHVPVINLWRALNRPGMINLGMDDSGLHLRTVAGGLSPALADSPTTFEDSVDFRPRALRAGANMRNLIWLKTLAALDRAAGVN